MLWVAEWGSEGHGCSYDWICIEEDDGYSAVNLRGALEDRWRSYGGAHPPMSNILNYLGFLPRTMWMLFEIFDHSRHLESDLFATTNNCIGLMLHWGHWQDRAGSSPKKPSVYGR